jgi:iron complex outermembrane receptor protein
MRSFVFSCAASLPLLSVAAFAQTPATSPSAPADSTIVLSPFQVDASAEKGYLATQTLNGTRLRTDIKDIGSAISIFTEQMMDDLGANNINSLMAFAPNTDAFIQATGDITGNGNDFINISTQFVTRGGATSVVSQDFFANNIPNDRYNSEALTFTRGPNAILFGLGNAAGAFVSSTKRAKTNKTATTIDYQIDQRGSYRGMLDHNHVLKPGLLAIRYAGVYEALNTFRIPTENLQRRHFAAATFTPFRTTTLRASYEKGLINAPAVRPWPSYDFVTPWLAAGSPIIPAFVNVAGGKPVGTKNDTFTGVVSTDLTPAGTKVAPQVWVNTGLGADPAFNTPGFPSNTFPVQGARYRSLTNDAIYPTLASLFGNTAFRLNDYKTLSVFLEQQVTRDLFIEAAYNRQENRLIALNGVVGQSAGITVDPNAQMPNGQPNPNVGKFYYQSQSTRIDAPTEGENYRLTGSYTLDFGRQKSKWLRHLGRHQAALFGEQSNSRGWSSNNNLYNVTPFATTGAAANITNGANLLQYRYYFDAAAGKIGTSGGEQFLNFPVMYAGTPIPPKGPNGVTPGFVAQQGLNMSESHVRTYALATQSFFWNNRIVFTSGWREDDVTSWSATPGDFNPLRDANGFGANGDGIDVRKFKPGSRLARGGKTSTRGLVFHATTWLSLSYNTSNNFQVNASGLNVYGDLRPNPSGKGEDFGLKFALFDRKLFLDLTYYTNSSINSADAVSSNAAGDFKTNLDQSWIAIYNFTGDLKYNTYPYNAIGTTWADVVSTKSEGYEFSLTANPTRNWRTSLNGSWRSNNTTSERGVFINQYLAQYLPVIKARPEWQNLIASGQTVAARVAELERILVNFNAIRNSPSASFASKWTLNLVQSYDLPATGIFRGIGIGGSMNARGKAINGFAVDAANLLDVTKPYYAPAYANFGAWISYKRKIFHDRVDWRLQLNVRNVLDDHVLYPLSNVDRRDGRNTPVTAVYTLREPRTYQFTSAFRF